MLSITPGHLQLNNLRQCWQSIIPITLDTHCLAAIDASYHCVQNLLKQDKAIYGVNTGFGRLANHRIDSHQLTILQENLLLSHACGTGPLLPDHLVRLILLLKINSLAQGFSGVPYHLIETLMTLHNQQIYPCIPSKGSVGASGDLAPLAHLSTVLIGAGDVTCQGERMTALQGLAKAGLKPLQLTAKSGLALINGLQVSCAHALEALFLTERVWQAAVVAGSLSLEACAGSRVPFDDRIHQLRKLPAQQETARVFRELLQESDIQRSHTQCERVQDPYSLRCQPQVMGACLSHIQFASQIFLSEANAVSDNPLIFADENDILSGGNFHGQAIAMAADTLAIAIAEIGALSERRIALLMDNHLSGLPAFLVKESGVNSGFMIPQVVAAALASENKSLAHPASVDSIPTSANQEDHVSMANFATRRLLQLIENTATIIAIELIAACQGLDLRAPLKTSEPLEKIKAEIRKHVTFYERDRMHAPDIEVVKQLVMSGVEWLRVASDVFG